MKLLECVPNFSIGTDGPALQNILSAITAVPGTVLLNYECGVSANRTVISFAGPPDSVIKSAYHSAEAAVENIDMQTHKGTHPRIGALDVCPLIPLKNISTSECIRLARELGNRIATNLGIPIFLYGKAALLERRRRLPDIRTGGYEALQAKLKNPFWHPDFGPAVFNARSGATALGVRDILLAYNINLKTEDIAAAKYIARIIRSSGYKGNPGLLSNCQADGWFIKEFGCAQVTTNLTDFRKTGFHNAYTTVRTEAEKLGISVTGSELVGLSPLQALLNSGIFFAKQKTGFKQMKKNELIDLAIQSLGLHDKKPFTPENKIIEYLLEKNQSN